MKDLRLTSANGGFQHLRILAVLLIILFFFQAEDGIRDRDVTGVQTCALPIWRMRAAAARHRSPARSRRRIREEGPAERTRAAGRRIRRGTAAGSRGARAPSLAPRSEERRVGKEGRSREARWLYH